MTPSPRLLTHVLIAAALIGCATERAALAPPAALVRCTLLIPLRYNDGTPVPDIELRTIEDRLFERFGGYTLAGRVRGTYRMPDGTKAADESLAVWVAIPVGRVAQLRAEAARIAARLGQETVYFERGGGQVDFVSAAEGDVP